MKFTNLAILINYFWLDGSLPHLQERLSNLFDTFILSWIETSCFAREEEETYRLWNYLWEEEEEDSFT